MKLLPLAATILGGISSVEAGFYKGFNIASNNIDGSCKTTNDWSYAFQKIAALPGRFTSVRVYASSDCNTLANAVPAAKSHGVQLLVGVWTENEAHFTQEKNALEAAIKTYGKDWILAISVGSEDLYRKEANPNRLAQQIYDVRGMVRAMGVQAQVGHVDTWTAWVDRANDAVTKACDFIGMDGYPYFQGSKIEDSANVFWQSLKATRDVVNQVHPGAWVWVTETMWPVSGKNFGAAVPSVANAQKYWKDVACPLFGQAHTFMYAYQDYNSNPSFGLFNKNNQPAYDTTC